MPDEEGEREKEMYETKTKFNESRLLFNYIKHEQEREKKAKVKHGKA